MRPYYQMTFLQANRSRSNQIVLVYDFGGAQAIQKPIKAKVLRVCQTITINERK